MSNHHHQIQVFTLSSLILSLLLLIPSATVGERCHPDDKKALFRIKNAFNNAHAFATWTPDTDCCTSWYFVFCHDRTNRVLSLNISRDDGVAGPIPDAVGDLPYLLALFFTDLPNLIGPIPPAVTRLKDLNTLWIAHTGITGPIPDFLGRMKTLTYINLAGNKLSGKIPPSFSALPELGYLSLQQNRLTGPIPESFGQFKGKLYFYVYLGKNQLSGPIPKSLGSVNFTELDLSKNHNLIGDASIFFGANKGLQRVDLSRNQFSFDITKVVFPKSLSKLDLSHNNIYGSLSSSLSKIELQEFNVSYNRLCGPIPTGGSLQKFDKYLYEHNKCLCGSPLPPCK